MPPEKVSSFLLGAIQQPDPAQHFRDARFQRRAAQSVKMSLVPQIFGGGQLHVNTLGLEDYANLAAQLGWVPWPCQIP